MQISKNTILEIIREGEGIKTEFKVARNKLPKSLFETVCAFLNTKGGIILLGVDDNGKITGVDNKSVLQLKKDIANLSNNPEKLLPAIMLNIYELKIDAQIIIVIEVPESSQVHKTAKNIFIRNNDGDYKISHPVQIAKIVNRKQNYHSAQRVFTYVKFEQLSRELIKKAKNLIRLNNPENHWTELDNKEFLVRAGFYKVDDTGNKGYTLAAILFFGTDELIQSMVPAYKFEALLRKENIDRYDDRITIRTNLLDAYDLLMSFIEKHLNDPFYLEGTTRISLRSKIFRELVANIIAHREYLSPAQAYINIFKDKIEFVNPNNPTVFGKIEPEQFTPLAKNPTISKLMLQMGMVEEVGSGMRNTYKYLPYYAKGASIEFIDEDLFKTIVYLGNDSGKSSGKSSGKILDLIKQDENITIPQIAEYLNITTRGVEKQIAALKKQGILKREGSRKSGYWKITSS